MASQVPLLAAFVAMKPSMLGQKLPVLAGIVEPSCGAIALLTMLAGGNSLFQARDGSGVPAVDNGGADG